MLMSTDMLRVRLTGITEVYLAKGTRTYYQACGIYVSGAWV